MAKDIIHGTEIESVRAQDLRLGDLVGPSASVTEVRRLAPLKVLVRTSTGHSDVCAPGRWYHVAADRPTGVPALEQSDAADAAPGEEYPRPWYCDRCDLVVAHSGQHHRDCALAEEDRHPDARP